MDNNCFHSWRRTTLSRQLIHQLNWLNRLHDADIGSSEYNALLKDMDEYCQALNDSSNPMFQQQQQNGKASTFPQAALKQVLQSLSKNDNSNIEEDLWHEFANVFGLEPVAQFNEASPSLTQRSATTSTLSLSSNALEARDNQVEANTGPLLDVAKQMGTDTSIQQSLRTMDERQSTSTLSTPLRNLTPALKSASSSSSTPKRSVKKSVSFSPDLFQEIVFEPVDDFVDAAESPLIPSAAVTAVMHNVVDDDMCLRPYLGLRTPLALPKHNDSIFFEAGFDNPSSNSSKIHLTAEPCFDYHVSLHDRAAEMATLMDQHMDAFNIIHSTCFAYKENEWPDFVKLLVVPREQMDDLTWIHRISTYLESEPSLLAHFKEIVGYDYHSEHIFEDYDFVDDLYNPKTSPLMMDATQFQDKIQFEGREEVFDNGPAREKTWDVPSPANAIVAASDRLLTSKATVPARGHVRFLDELKTSYPEFFECIRYDFKKWYGDSTYLPVLERFDEVLAMPRSLMDDTEWLNYVLNEFLGQSHQRRKQFRDMVTSVRTDGNGLVGKSIAEEDEQSPADADDAVPNMQVADARSSPPLMCRDVGSMLLTLQQLEQLRMWKNRLNEKEFSELLHLIVDRVLEYQQGSQEPPGRRKSDSAVAMEYVAAQDDRDSIQSKMGIAEDMDKLLKSWIDEFAKTHASGAVQD